jgi:hypothetical protein
MQAFIAYVCTVNQKLVMFEFLLLKAVTSFEVLYSQAIIQKKNQNFT